MTQRARRLAGWARAHLPDLLAALVTVALVPVATHRLGENSLWLDEAVSISIADASLSHFWKVVTGSDMNQVLYYLALRPWLAFGDSEGIVRGLSVVWAVATIPVVYLLARRLIGQYPALVAASFTAANAFLLRYAQEARGYTLLVFATSLSTLLLVEAVRRDRRALWIGYGLVAGVSLYVHFFASLTLLAHLVSLAWAPKVRRAHLGLAAGVTVAVGLPAAVYVVRHLGAGQIAWIPVPTLETVRRALQGLAGAEWFLPALLVYGLAVVGACAAVATRRAWPAALLVLSFAVPIVLSVTVSVLVKPVFMPQYVIATIVPLVIMAAWGISALRSRLVAVAAAMIVLGISLGSLSGVYGQPREDWRSTTAAVIEAADEGGHVVILAGYSRIPFEYYVRRLGAPAADPLFPPQPWGTMYYADGRTGSLREVVDRVAVGDRIWLVLRTSPYELDEVISMLGAREVASREFAGWIRLIELEVVREPRRS